MGGGSPTAGDKNETEKQCRINAPITHLKSSILSTPSVNSVLAKEMNTHTDVIVVSKSYCVLKGQSHIRELVMRLSLTVQTSDH